MSGEPQKIGGFILEALNRMGVSDRLKKQQAVTGWSEIVGEKIAAQTEALRIDGDTLVVKVHQAVWRQQLQFLKDDLLTKLKKELEGDIKDIRFL
ncbi:MAG: DUF721 domain-containing protein [candidate division Zixibacteria bacterium]